MIVVEKSWAVNSYIVSYKGRGHRKYSLHEIEYSLHEIEYSLHETEYSLHDIEYSLPSIRVGQHRA